MVLKGSPIYALAEMGQIAAIKRLFDNGLASPYDTDDSGYTPLRVSSCGLLHAYEQIKH